MLQIQTNVRLSEGWRISEVHVRPGSPIALLVFSRDGSPSVSVRIDLAKQMLLDPIPVRVDADPLADIIDMIGRRQRQEFARAV